jgi:nucleotide-binding universal stress UspA family protein
MFKQILVPLDGTPESNVSLPLARSVAEATGASIGLLQVIDDRPLSPADVLLNTDQVPSTAADKGLAGVAAELRSVGLKVETYTSHGDVAAEIIKRMRMTGTDLIIMRTHGHAGLQRAALGSVTERVLSHSDIPMLLLRPGGRRVTTIRRLLIPVDGSPGGAIGLATAVGLARAAGAQLDLVEVVVPVYRQAWGKYEGLMYYDPTWDDEALASARAYVDGLVGRLTVAGLIARGEARIASDVSADIVLAARAHEADLIVMSTHALTGLSRALLGSVADAVVRTAGCPVLLVHRSLPDHTTPVPEELSAPKSRA